MTKVRNAIFACLIATAVSSAAVDPSLLNLVMPDAKFISGIHVEASKNSAFGKYVLSQMRADDPAFTNFIAETGFDPRSDLTEIVVATAGTSDKPLLLAVGLGKFNSSRILTAAQAKGAAVTDYNGFQILTHATRGSAEGALAFPQANLAVMGTVESVHGAIDRFKSTSVLPEALTERANNLSAANDAWFLSTGPVSDFFAGKVADPKLGNAMQAGLMQAILQASGGIKFNNDGVSISGEALTRSAKDATSLADVVRFLAGMVQLNRDSDPNAQKVATMLDTLTLSTNDATMKLSLVVPEAMIEQLFVPGTKSPARARTRRADLRQ